MVLVVRARVLLALLSRVGRAKKDWSFCVVVADGHQRYPVLRLLRCVSLLESAGMGLGGAMVVAWLFPGLSGAVVGDGSLAR